MNSYEYLFAKRGSEQMGYPAQPSTATGPRTGGLGAPALPPAPSTAPTTSAPAPSPKPNAKIGGMLDDVETALRRRRLMQHAQASALEGAAPAVERYQQARNTALKGVGMRGLGLGLGGLALYGGGKALMNHVQQRQPQDAAYPTSSEDFAG